MNVQNRQKYSFAASVGAGIGVGQVAFQNIASSNAWHVAAVMGAMLSAMAAVVVYAITYRWLLPVLCPAKKPSGPTDRGAV